MRRDGGGGGDVEETVGEEEIEGDGGEWRERSM